MQCMSLQDSPLRSAANSAGRGLEPYLGAACSSMGVQYSATSREKDLAEKLFRCPPTDRLVDCIWHPTQPYPTLPYPTLSKSHPMSCRHRAFKAMHVCLATGVQVEAIRNASREVGAYPNLT